MPRPSASSAGTAKAVTFSSRACRSMHPELMISLWCPQQGHIATRCPTTTTEIDASPSSSLRKEQQVLLCVGRRGMILPRVMSHERQSFVGAGARLGSLFRKLWEAIVSELTSKLFRRKPAIEMDTETGAE